jgi:hypothetical protein
MIQGPGHLRRVQCRAVRSDRRQPLPHFQHGRGTLLEVSPPLCLGDTRTALVDRCGQRRNLAGKDPVLGVQRMRFQEVVLLWSRKVGIPFACLIVSIGTATDRFALEPLFGFRLRCRLNIVHPDRSLR